MAKEREGSSLPGHFEHALFVSVCCCRRSLLIRAFAQRGDATSPDPASRIHLTRVKTGKQILRALHRCAYHVITNSKGIDWLDQLSSDDSVKATDGEDGSVDARWYDYLVC